MGLRSIKMGSPSPGELQRSEIREASIHPLVLLQDQGLGYPKKLSSNVKSNSIFRHVYTAVAIEL